MASTSDSTSSSFTSSSGEEVDQVSKPTSWITPHVPAPYEPRAIPTTIAPVSYSGRNTLDTSTASNPAAVAQQLQGQQFTVVSQQVPPPSVLTHASPGSKVTYSLPAGTVVTPTATPTVVHSTRPAEPARSAFSTVSQQISAAVQASKLPVIATDAASPLARSPVHHVAPALAAPGQAPAPKVALNAPARKQASRKSSRGSTQKSADRSGPPANESLAVKTNTLVSRGDGTNRGGPRAWVMVPVPDAAGGVQFRPRGFSVGGSTELAASEADSTPWDIRDKYLVAVRSGPTECPDHILAKHKHFSKGKDAFTSPYTVFYFDETAPNAVLLDNDVRPKSAPKVDAKTGKRVPTKGAIRPKRRVSEADAEASTNYTESDSEDLRLPSRAGGSQAPEQAPEVAPQTREVPDATTATHSAGSSVTSTHYVSMQPLEVAGCCGARRRVSVDGGSYYGSSAYGSSARYDRQEPADYVRVVTLSQPSGASTSSESTSLANYADARYFSTEAAEYRGAPGRFLPAALVPPSYPPQGSSMLDDTSTEQTSEVSRDRRRACCGGITRRLASSEDTTSEESEAPQYTSTSTSSVSSSAANRPVPRQTSTRQASTHRTSTRHTSRMSSATHNHRRGPVCGVCRSQKARAQTASEETYTSYTVSMPSTGSMSQQPTSRHSHHTSSRQASRQVAPKAASTTTTSSSVSSVSVEETGSMPAIAEEALTCFSSDVETGAPMLKPSTKNDRQRDLSYNVRKMFFDVDDLRVPTGDKKGTGLKMLPGYSVSYRNYPVICYDVIAPKDYQDFFRPRKTPGMFA